MSASFSPTPGTPAYTSPPPGADGVQEPPPFDPAARADGMVSDGTLDRMLTGAMTTTWSEPAQGGSELPPGYVPQRSGVQAHEFGARSFGTANTPDKPYDPEKPYRQGNRPPPNEGRFRTSTSSGSNNVPTSMLFGRNYQQVGGDDADVDKRHSARYQMKSDGDSRNGEKTVLEGGVWSTTATKTHADERGILASASASGSAGGTAEGGGSVTAGPVALDGNGKAYATAEGRASAGASWSSETGHYVQAGFESRAAVGYEGSASARLGPLEYGVGGKTMAGVEASTGFFAGERIPTAEERALGIVRKSGLEASAGVFAGVKAEGNAHVGINGSNIGVSAGGYAGVGVDASVKAGVSNDAQGRKYLDISAKAGAAIGVGGSLGFSVHLNLTALINAYQRISKIYKSAERFLNFIPAFQVLKGVATFVVARLKLVGKAFLKRLKTIAGAAVKVGKAIANAAKKFGKACKKFGQGVKKAAQKVGGFFKKLFGRK